MKRKCCSLENGKCELLLTICACRYIGLQNVKNTLYA